MKHLTQVLSIILSIVLVAPPAYSARPKATAVASQVEAELSRELLATNGAVLASETRVEAEGRKVRFGFDKKEAYFTNSIATASIGNFFTESQEIIPDEIVEAVKKKLDYYVSEGFLKSHFVFDVAGTDLTIHVTHNYGERNASVHRLILEALVAGMREAYEMGLTLESPDEISWEDFVKTANIRANDDSKVERGAESVVVAQGVGVSIGAANIKLYNEFAVTHSTPLQKLGLKKSPGFRFRVKRVQDIVKGISDGKEWEFEVSTPQYDEQGNLVVAPKNDVVHLLALASQPNDYAITHVYPVEGGALPSYEPIATVNYQPVYGTDGEPALNPTIIYRSQSGGDAVGGIASLVYEPNVVPGGPTGENFVVTSPATLEEARRAPEEGIGSFLIYAYQSREDGVIPPEGVRDHKGFNPPSYWAEERKALSLAEVLRTHTYDQPYLSPGAAEAQVEEVREAQNDLFIPTTKESEADPLFTELEKLVQAGALLSVTDDKADMGGRIGHTNVPEMMVAIYRATLMEAMENGTISYGNTAGFAGKHSRVQDVENVGVGDDGHMLMIGDKSLNAADSHQLSFLAFTRAYHFAVLNGKKYYGTGQDFQGPEAKKAKENPFAFSQYSSRFFEILGEVMPENEIKLGVIDKVVEEWETWKETGEESGSLTEPFNGNVSQQGIGSARYLLDPTTEDSIDMIAGDKMGPAALNRIIRETTFNAVDDRKSSFNQKGLVFEIWDLKAFDSEGNVAWRDVPQKYEDVASLSYKTDADRDYIASFYVNGTLNKRIAKADQEKIRTILKNVDFVPSRRILLDAVEDREAIIKYLADSDRFNVRHVWNKVKKGWDINNALDYLDRPIMAASVTRLGILAGGEYVGKDDPVMIGNTELFKYAHTFLKNNPVIVQGDMNGSHWEPAVPTELKYAVATQRSHPIFVGLRYKLNKDRTALTSVVDIYQGSKDYKNNPNVWDKQREVLFDFGRELIVATLAQFEPHGTNFRTVEGSYELAKILRALEREDSPFLISNKKEAEGESNRSWPEPMANNIQDVYEVAFTDAALPKVAAASETREVVGDPDDDEELVAFDLPAIQIPAVAAQDASRARASVANSLTESYIFDYKFVEQGGLSLVRGVFGNMPAAVLVRTPEQASFVAAFNEQLAENEPKIMAAYTVSEAQALINLEIKNRGLGDAFKKTKGIVLDPTSSEAEALSRELKDGDVRYLSQGIFNQMLEVSGLSLVAQQLRGHFAALKSA